MTRLSLVVLIVIAAVFAAQTEKKSNRRFEKGRMADLSSERKAAYHSHLKLAAQTRAKTSGKQFLFAFPNSHIDANDTSYTEQLSVIVTNTDPSQTASVRGTLENQNAAQMFVDLLEAKTDTTLMKNAFSQSRRLKKITITSNYVNFTTITDTVAPGQSKLITVNPVDIQANYNDKYMEVALLESKVSRFLHNLIVKGLLLTSNVAVEVVAENVHTDGGSGDNYDLIPTCQLGNAYRTVSDEGTRRGQNSTNIFVIVALQDNTTIRTNYVQTWTPALQAQQTASFVSKWWQTDIHVDTLGGNAAVISAAVCGYGYSYAQGCSHESMMMTPISAWGTQFPFAKLKPQTQYEILVIGANDGTDVTANGEFLDTIDDGWYLIVWNDECDFIETTKPALVVIVGTSSIDGQSAPFFVQVPPPEQYSTGSTQFATGMTTTDLTKVTHYVRLTTTIDNIGKLAIDGYYPNPLLYMRAGKSNFYYVDQLISNGTHVVNGNNGVKFSTTVYGYGPNIGYAYTPGLELPANGDC